jgi:hypothetical protein
MLATKIISRSSPLRIPRDSSSASTTEGVAFEYPVLF